tara:strand:- start:237 stop:446 length:210 start_codon:yes stop_codon:yes gene_type:complete
MSNYKTTSLEKIGYIRVLPKNSDINNYESILIRDSEGKEIKLYRLIDSENKYDDVSDFRNSWKVFNSFV